MLTTAEAAAILQVSRRRVNELITLGTLKAERFGNAWQVDSESIEAYKNSPRKAGRPKQPNAAHTSSTPRPSGARGRDTMKTITMTNSTDIQGVEEYAELFWVPSIGEHRELSVWREANGAYAYDYGNDGQSATGFMTGQAAYEAGLKLVPSEATATA